MESSKSLGWVFSRKLDLLFFLTPVIGVSALIAFGSFDLSSASHTLIGVLCIKVFLDMNHVCSTLFPLTHFSKEKLIPHKKFFFETLAILTISYVVFINSNTLFFAIFALLTIYHITKQQLGWLSFSRRNFGPDKTSHYLEKALIYCFAFYPVLFWLSHNKVSPKDLITPGTLDLGLPMAAMTTLNYVYWSMILFYGVYSVALYIKGNKINWPKLVILISTWTWAYVPIVIFNSPAAYLITGVLLHSIPYMYINSRDFKARNQNSSSLYPLLVSSLLACVWFSAILFVANTKYALGYFEPLFLLPSLLHFYYDGLIWKRKNYDNKEFVKVTAGDTAGFESPRSTVNTA